MTESSEFDVLVIGGGLAGASLACALANTGLRLGMVEAVPFSEPGQPSYDERTTAISWGTRGLFEGLGVWQDMAAEAAPITRLHVSEAGRFGATRVHSDDYGVEALGYVLPNRVLGRALYARLEGVENLQIFSPAKFVGLTRQQDSIEVEVDRDGAEAITLKTRLLIGADGARSPVRDALGVVSRVHDYEQKAVVTAVTPGRGHENTAYERFTPQGPVAVLPRPGQRCAVVWTLPAEKAEDLKQMPDDGFVRALQQRFGYRLGALSEPGVRNSYPLIRLVCDNPTAERAVLVGNAGHNLHPAAAQGFNLAMRDITELARLLARADAEGNDPGNSELIRCWRQARRADQHRVGEFTDRIVKIFSNNIPGLGPMRGLGLTGLELLPTIKHDMARRSMGLAMQWPME